MRKECAKWQVEKELVDQGLIQLKNGQDDDSCGVSYHCLSVVEEFARDCKQREVIGSRIDEEFN